MAKPAPRRWLENFLRRGLKLNPLGPSGPKIGLLQGQIPESGSPIPEFGSAIAEPGSYISETGGQGLGSQKWSALASRPFLFYKLIYLRPTKIKEQEKGRGGGGSMQQGVVGIAGFVILHVTATKF
jgi:hypothetical protein